MVAVRYCFLDVLEKLVAGHFSTHFVFIFKSSGQPITICLADSVQNFRIKNPELFIVEKLLLD